VTGPASAYEPWQVMPPLSTEEYAGLREDIAAHGVLVPITVDQHGVIIDGHHRAKIAEELGISCPRAVREFANDDERHDAALGLNLKRRHLNREQMRELIAVEFERTPEASDRAVARRLGCSPSTVGAVRRVSKLDSGESLTEEERRLAAEEFTERIRDDLADWDRLAWRCIRDHLGTFSPAVLAKLFQQARSKALAECADWPSEFLTFWDERWWCAWLDELAALHALWQGWKVDDKQWSAWLETWAQARPSQHRETTGLWREAMRLEAAS
jgi:ParB-like chromosome segregation protein Spo0J